MIDENHNFDDCEFCALASFIDEAEYWAIEWQEYTYEYDGVYEKTQDAYEDIRKLPVCSHYRKRNRLICTLCGGCRGTNVGPVKVEERTCDCPLWGEYRDSQGSIYHFE